MITKKKILVIGDVMLDRYWMGQVNRISPEAPVPILDVNDAVDKPGGAANVATVSYTHLTLPTKA